MSFVALTFHFILMPTKLQKQKKTIHIKFCHFPWFLPKAYVSANVSGAATSRLGLVSVSSRSRKHASRLSSRSRLKCIVHTWPLSPASCDNDSERYWHVSEESERISALQHQQLTTRCGISELCTGVQVSSHHHVNVGALQTTPSNRMSHGALYQTLIGPLSPRHHLFNQLISQKTKRWFRNLETKPN